MKCKIWINIPKKLYLQEHDCQKFDYEQKSWLIWHWQPYKCTNLSVNNKWHIIQIVAKGLWLLCVRQLCADSCV